VEEEEDVMVLMERRGEEWWNNITNMTSEWKEYTTRCCRMGS
jgi:hypothetical protein